MPQYSTLKIVPHVAENFRNYSRSLNKNQSETLHSLLDFFSRNKLSIYDNVEVSIAAIEKRIFNRFDAYIAIVKSIEKKELIPTLNMVKYLYDTHHLSSAEKIQKEEVKEEHQQDLLYEFPKELQENLLQLLTDLKPNGRGQFILEIEQNEVTALIRQVKNI